MIYFEISDPIHMTKANANISTVLPHAVVLTTRKKIFSYVFSTCFLHHQAVVLAIEISKRSRISRKSLLDTCRSLNM